MDTVFKRPPEEIFFDPKHNVMWSPQGLGADDRAGVFAIIQLIRTGLRPHIIFTTDEELGALGALSLSKLDCPFTELKYLIQLDRRGSNDCVFYDCDNQAFIDYIESFGFNFNYGTFTDISELCPAWKRAGVNLSVGYRNEHSEAEVLHVGQLLDTIAKVQKMLLDAINVSEFAYIPSLNSFNKGWCFTNLPVEFKQEAQVMKCSKCRKYFMEEELIPTVMSNKTTEYFCFDCMTNNVSFCTSCGNAYEITNIDEMNGGLCPWCREREEKNNGNRPKVEK